ncbi:hypothetical protein C1645_882202 [Glomus cerebriforme]|uniref:Uncharacterized protein n=1 Tax=Glomus cerebriforme TaxID=658196 RepID=A0A397S6N5_9GLOM|nr:hypothetical protein C1645_882202 [Glomus cerebriforme]
MGNSVSCVSCVSCEIEIHNNSYVYYLQPVDKSIIWGIMTDETEIPEVISSKTMLIRGVQGRGDSISGVRGSFTFDVIHEFYKVKVARIKLNFDVPYDNRRFTRKATFEINHVCNKNHIQISTTTTWGGSGNSDDDKFIQDSQLNSKNEFENIEYITKGDFETIYKAYWKDKPTNWNNNNTISENLRWHVVYLHNDGYSLQEISELLKISVPTANYYKDNKMLSAMRCVTTPLKKQAGRRKMFNGSMKHTDYHLDEIIKGKLTKRFLYPHYEELEKAAKADFIYTLGTNEFLL